MLTMCSERSNEEIFSDIFLYVDELVRLIKPQGVLVISADGVAPRAKMNQQRTRRFRKSDINPKEVEELRKHGLNPDMMFNSDCISAGTAFMYDLSIAFENFVRNKLATDDLWKDLEVIVTGADVPGEGEHKVNLY
jgi:5'-3' exonuclease